jgi:uncharacterized damage-inducible protein DinB
MSFEVVESNKMDKNLPEPWLRGTITGVNPVVAQVLYSFQQAREDIDTFTAGLTVEQLWRQPSGLASVGFHIRHIAGSVDRLFTYVLGRMLSDNQLAALKHEMEPGASREELLAAMDTVFRNIGEAMKALSPDVFDEPRMVGRKKLPTTVAGLVVHIAEHTQRHVGQAIVTAKLVHAASLHA